MSRYVVVLAAGRLAKVVLEAACRRVHSDVNALDLLAFGQSSQHQGRKLRKERPAQDVVDVASS